MTAIKTFRSIELGDVCGDCALIVANDDASGMSDERERQVRAGLQAIRSQYPGGSIVIVEPTEWGADEMECGLCCTRTYSTTWWAAVLIP